MASNRLPREREQLLSFAEEIANGLREHEAAIGIKQNTEATVRAVSEKTRTAIGTYRNAVNATKALTTAQTAADSQAKAFIASSKRVLTNFLGAHWTSAWATAGFSNNSLAIPATVAERQILLATLTDYLKTNSGHEIAQFKVTAAEAEAVYTALKTARAQVNMSNGVLGQAKATVEKAEEDLRKRMIGVLGELTQLLSSDDPLWYAFGLNRPADPALPGIPDNLVLTLGLNGTIHATWAPARRAARYRVFKKEATEDAFGHSITVGESEATITELAAGVVQIQVTAANEAGESQPCTAAQITIPAAIESVAVSVVPA